MGGKTDQPKEIRHARIWGKIEVIIFMDTNESAKCRTGEMLALMWASWHSHDSWLILGKRGISKGEGKIDIILMTPNTQQYNEWIISDHMALIVDIDYKNLELGGLVFWQRPKRSCTSSPAKSRRRFVEKWYQKGKTKLDPDTWEVKEEHERGGSRDVYHCHRQGVQKTQNQTQTTNVCKVEWRNPGTSDMDNCQ